MATVSHLCSASVVLCPVRCQLIVFGSTDRKLQDSARVTSDLREYRDRHSDNTPAQLIFQIMLLPVITYIFLLQNNFNSDNFARLDVTQSRLIANDISVQLIGVSSLLNTN